LDAAPLAEAIEADAIEGIEAIDPDIIDMLPADIISDMLAERTSVRPSTMVVIGVGAKSVAVAIGVSDKTTIVCLFSRGAAKAEAITASLTNEESILMT